MTQPFSIVSDVTTDGRTLHIEFLHGPTLGPTLWLTRDEAMALLEVLQEQLPKMAVRLEG